MKRRTVYGLILEIEHHMPHEKWVDLVLVGATTEIGWQKILEARCEMVGEKVNAVRKTLDELRTVATEKGYDDILEVLDRDRDCEP